MENIPDSEVGEGVSAASEGDATIFLAPSLFPFPSTGLLAA